MMSVFSENVSAREAAVEKWRAFCSVFSFVCRPVSASIMTHILLVLILLFAGRQGRENRMGLHDIRCVCSSVCQFFCFVGCCANWMKSERLGGQHRVVIPRKPTLLQSCNIRSFHSCCGVGFLRGRSMPALVINLAFPVMFAYLSVH